MRYAVVSAAALKPYIGKIVRREAYMDGTLCQLPIEACLCVTPFSNCGDPVKCKSLVLIFWSPSDWRQSTASGLLSVTVALPRARAPRWMKMRQKQRRRLQALFSKQRDYYARRIFVI